MKNDTNFYENLFENQQAVIFVIDSTNGNFLYANATAKKYYGCFDYQISNLCLYLITYPNSEQIKKEIKKTIKNGSNHFRTKHKLVSEEIRDIELSVSTISHNKTSSLLCIAKDITSEIDIKKLFDESMLKYQTLFESAYDAIILMKDATIIDCNIRALEIFGYDNKLELMGLNILNMAPIEQPDGKSSVDNAKHYISLALEGVPQRFHWRNLKKDGSLIDVELSLNKILIKGKELLLVVGHDITEKLEAINLLIDKEERIRILHESANDSIFIMENETIISTNKKGAEIYGYENEHELHGLTVFDLSPDLQPNGEKSKELGLKYIEAALKGNAQSFLWKHKKKNTELIDVEVSLNACVIKNTTYIQAIGRDVTARLMAESKLKQSELKYRTLHETMIQGVIYFNMQGEVISINSAALRILGLKDDQISLKNKNIFNQAIYENGLEFPKTKFPQFIAINESIEITGSVIGVYNSIDKEYRWINVHAVPLYINSKDKPDQVYITIENITERKNSEKIITEKRYLLEERNQEFIVTNEELMESNLTIREINEELSLAKDNAEESDRLKSAFLANISHEIRTPMNGIKGFVDLLAINYSMIDDTVANYIEIIKECSDQLLSIVNDIVTISKIESVQEKMFFKQVIVKDVLEDTLRSFANTSQKLDIPITIEYENPENLYITITDQSRLSQILQNIISNAFKFTYKGSVEVKLMEKDSFLLFSIKDTGIGIEEDMYLKIFQKFRQGYNEDLSMNYSGLGLGLPISKSLVELLGGILWFESKKNYGSTFYFTIPILEAETNESTFIHKPEDISRKKTLLNLLIVEDEESNFMLLNELLKDKEIRIQRAHDGQEAIDICKSENAIDLILMDIKMPKVNGCEASIIIKELQPDIKIVAQTAYKSILDDNVYVKGIFDDIIEKPINNEILNTVINKHIGLCQA